MTFIIHKVLVTNKFLKVLDVPYRGSTRFVRSHYWHSWLCEIWLVTMSCYNILDDINCHPRNRVNHQTIHRWYVIMRQEEEFMITQYLPNIFNMKIDESSQKSASHLISKHNRSKCYIALKIATIPRIKTEFDKHLKCSLWMPDISLDLACFCYVLDIGHMCWDVVYSHFIEGKFPELLIFSSVLFMLIGVPTPSAVC